MYENETNENKMKYELPYYLKVTYQSRQLNDNAHIYKELTYIKYCPIK